MTNSDNTQLYHIVSLKGLSCSTLCLIQTQSLSLCKGGNVTIFYKICMPCPVKIMWTIFRDESTYKLQPTIFVHSLHASKVGKCHEVSGNRHFKGLIEREAKHSIWGQICIYNAVVCNISYFEQGPKLIKIISPYLIPQKRGKPCI